MDLVIDSPYGSGWAGPWLIYLDEDFVETLIQKIRYLFGWLEVNKVETFVLSKNKVEAFET